MEPLASRVCQSLAHLKSPSFRGSLLRSASVLERHGTDESYHAARVPDAVAVASCEADVQAVLRTCNDFGFPVIPYGAGTSLEGHIHALKGGISLDVAEMNSVLSVDPDEMTATVQCGILRSQLDNYLRDTGMFFPVDPGADATLGGMISTSASGTTTVRYGRMRDNVLGLKVVLPGGKTIQVGKERRGCSSAVDLTSIFIGAEGTLGVVTEATLKLYPRPEFSRSVVCTFKSMEDAIRTSVKILQQGVGVSRLEFVDETSIQAVNRAYQSSHEEKPSLFLEFQGSETSTKDDAETVKAIANKNEVLDVKTATELEDQKKLWHARHNSYYAILALRKGGKGVISDACVPISRLAECIRETKEDIANTNIFSAMIGHVGDGNFHVIFVVDLNNEDEIRTAKDITSRLSHRAIRMGGTCTGEHGVGMGKIPYLKAECDATSLELMRTLKKTLDPKGIMNPGKIIPQ
mmetsp:Transcript_15459/g.63048  ORF Transcript_15459/g.63048 Transcript_15459/m.63048 type:complete len:464 (-) Transcript_15459:1426-2817(-)